MLHERWMVPRVHRPSARSAGWRHHSGRWMLYARSMRYLDDDDRRAVETGRSRASTASCCGIALQSSHAPVSPVSLDALHLIGSMRPVMTRQWSGGAWPVPALG